MKLSKKLHIAFDRCQEHDYGEITFVDQETAEESLAEARQFVDAIENYLTNSIYTTL